MEKRPSFQFYPSDWLTDTALRTCSVGARGLWMDMMCYMHEGDPYGHLKVNGKVILPPTLARMVGEPIDVVEGWLSELEDVGVFSKLEDGTIYSRRMVRDEEVRKARAAGGKKGGNPALVKGKDKRKDNAKVNLKDNHEVENEDNRKPTPSSSSSSSSSVTTPHTPQWGMTFADFWEAYPKKVARTACEKKWKSKRLNEKAEEIVADIETRKANHRPWRDGYIPNPLTYLNQERWADELEPVAGEQAEQKPWHESASGIEAKAVELGIPRGDESFPMFKRRVLQAAGVTA